MPPPRPTCTSCGSHDHTNWLCNRTARGLENRKQLFCDVCYERDHDNLACPSTEFGRKNREDGNVDDHYILDLTEPTIGIKQLLVAAGKGLIRLILAGLIWFVFGFYAGRSFYRDLYNELYEICVPYDTPAGRSPGSRSS